MMLCLMLSTREELQQHGIKRKTVCNSVVHEKDCKRNKTSVTSKKKVMLRRNMLLIIRT